MSPMGLMISQALAAADVPQLRRGYQPSAPAVRPDDGVWNARELWNAYKDDPKRQEHKENEQAQRQQQAESNKRRRTEEHLTARADSLEEEQHFREIIGDLREENQTLQKSNDLLRAESRGSDQIRLDVERMQSPASNDWLLHAGNVNFCRERTLFSDYQSLKDAYACKADGSKIRVLGKGTVNVVWKRQLGGQACSESISICGILHIPSANCNGLSIPGLDTNGWRLEDRQNSRIAVVDNRTNRSVFCANRTSGRNRICLAGERDDWDEPRHITYGTPIAISKIVTS